MSIPESMREHRLELPEDPVTSLNLVAMARTYATEKGLVKSGDAQSASADTLPMIRAYKVLPDTVGKTIAQRAAEIGSAGTALRTSRAGSTVVLTRTVSYSAGTPTSTARAGSAMTWRRTARYSAGIVILRVLAGWTSTRFDTVRYRAGSSTRHIISPVISSIFSIGPRPSFQ